MKVLESCENYKIRALSLVSISLTHTTFIQGDSICQSAAHYLLLARGCRHLACCSLSIPPFLLFLYPSLDTDCGLPPISIMLSTSSNSNTIVCGCDLPEPFFFRKVSMSTDITSGLPSMPSAVQLRSLELDGISVQPSNFLYLHHFVSNDAASVRTYEINFILAARAIYTLGGCSGLPVVCCHHSSHIIRGSRYISIHIHISPCLSAPSLCMFGIRRRNPEEF